ncbi:MULTISPECIES: hypothetical protein [Vibrio]|uniref:hypothetical protein n=1 Tax=Vibrio TaxID=662 RepID=UPI002074CFD9|nr:MULTISPECIES: hypothetical protein [Vibrio]MDS1833360.1 hypothetical protein [Vibrio vulnificus]USD53613.1 hypothetical protein J4N44_09835 [Vibrio sp. SCSIO 43155]HEB2779409.1 hypothetical protein [Vibrio vulnificus]
MDKFDISKFECRPTKELAKEYLDLKEAGTVQASVCESADQEGIALWFLIKNVKPVDIYCYLNARFGAPNGMQNLFKNQHSDNLFHWHYTLHYENKTVDIMCANYRIEVMHGFKFLDHQYALDSFLSDIKQDFMNYKKEISQFRTTLEKWSLFANPFYHNKSMIEYQVSALEALELDSCPAEGKVRPENKGVFEELSARYVQATSLAFGIRILAPVYAESFVNTLIFLLADSDVKKDQRLYESIVRQNIDIRVKQLHRNCSGFAHPVDYNNADSCKKLHSLFNKRNDLLHGNIDPKKSVYDTCYFQGNTPIFAEFKDMFTQVHTASLSISSPEQALEDYQTVQDFIAYVLMCLDEPTDQIVRQFLATQNPGWNEKTGRAGVLFPKHFVDGFAVTDVPIFESR